VVTEAARRHLVDQDLLCAAVTRTALAEELASLGTLVEAAPQRTDAATPSTAEVDTQRRAARELLDRLFEQLGGRARWAGARAVELSVLLVGGAEELRSTQALDLEVPRFVLRVEEGGTTRSDGEQVTWQNAGERRTLDAPAWHREAELGLFSLLHRLAAEGGLEARLSEQGLTLLDGVRCLGVLELDAEGLPARLVAAEPEARIWRFSGWRECEGLLVPSEVADETRGFTHRIERCRFLPRFGSGTLR
jgi:hypothetical protein